ncbi:MAG: site-2 protease family protein [Candidatus Saccharimonadales bacterium]
MQSDTLTLLLYAIPALVVAISLHEMMHAVTGFWLGDDTAHAHGRISFNPLRHIDPLTTVALPLILVLFGLPPFAAAKPVPINMYRLKFQEFGMALVGLAGPLTNLLLAIIFIGILRIIEPAALSALADGNIIVSGSYIVGFLSYSILLNIGLFVFNMIPFPPLDGSRILYALAPEPIQKVMMQIERMGFSAILLFMFVGFPLISPFIRGAQQMIIQLLT